MSARGRGRDVRDSSARTRRDFPMGATGAAQSRDMPGVVNCDLLGRHVAAQWRQLRRQAVQPRESHEVRCVRSTAAERPAPRDPVAALRGNGRTHRSGRADNKRVRVGEPRVGDQLGRYPPTRLMPPPLPTSHPTEPSSSAATSTTRMNSTGDSSGPPSAFGSHSRKSPTSANAANTASVNRRSRSKASRCSAISGASRRRASRYPATRSVSAKAILVHCPMSGVFEDGLHTPSATACCSRKFEEFRHR